MRRKSASYPSWMPRDRYGGIRAEHLAVMEASVAESDVDYLLVDGWQYELAALLSQIESVTLPPELLEKIYTGNDLAEPEGELIDQQPAVAAKLVKNIPRLEGVSRMIENQRRNFLDSWEGFSVPRVLGAQILRIALDYDQLIRCGISSDGAQETLARQRSRYDPVLVCALRDFEAAGTGWERKRVGVEKMEIGMVAGLDIKTKKGALLLRLSSRMRVLGN